MKKRYTLLFTSLLFGSVFIAIQAQADNTDGTEAAMHKNHGIVHSAASSLDDGPEKKYRLDAFVQTIKGKKYLKVMTNLRLTDNNYGGDRVPGEGHIHYYLDGKIVGPITDMKLYPLDNLHEGTNQIRLVLAQNNHWENFGVSKELTIVND
ncbi:hypothetical protein KZ483_25235 [Paenibacillus sp. sptzw28]|uniref:hypothetical protein n=1 Tax=Paenibacillus sp. sptzw28 TaxID=715179 RepID=UPI001C6F462E|nr:hypothetical protein [Paenibacillus sp. sptzw28]QYR21001.1 hypothetical protein KZ483_25235 [Paenibacillus sp. sptzw28]